MSTLIESVSDGVPAALTELRKLGRTLKQRAGDVLAYFDRPGTSNGVAMSGKYGLANGGRATQAANSVPWNRMGAQCVL
jgi:hypothetical protein